MPKGHGRIIYTTDKAWTVQLIELYDEGTRPILQLSNKTSSVEVSYIIFPNNTGGKDSDACREAIVRPNLRGLSSLASIKDEHVAKYVTQSGKNLATHSYLIASLADVKIEQQNLFGFFGNTETCFEVHISKAKYSPSDEKLLTAELDRFDFDPDFQPKTQDYFALASIFFQARKQPALAAYYYRSALDSLPPPSPTQDTQILTLRRVITDQLVMSYGMSGNLKQSRALSTTAIAIDPDYPLNYYNLACADAEQGHAADAKIHLQQAFDRKANTIRGETFPDPAKDDSFLKLKKNKEFWAFVETLH